VKTIGIIGANGQVGSEVALFLSAMKDVRVVPICRNPIGATFLRRCGLDVRLGSVGSAEETGRLLEGLDLVADFSLPAGSSSQVRGQMASVITPTIRFAPRGIPFVYLSSILAYGNPDFHSELRHYVIARNAYGSTKRFAEHLANRLGHQTKRPVYLFRVGVVHGELQSASRKLIQDMRASADEVAFLPDCPSYTVFAFSIAEALMSAALGRDAPGMYTLVSNPVWTWKDLHAYFMKRAGVQQRVELLSPDVHHASLLRRVSVPLFGFLRSQKEFVNGYIGAHLPKVEQRLRAEYHVRVARAEIEHGEIARQYRPFFNNHGVYPGNRLSGLSDSQLAMHEPATKLRSRLADLVRPVATLP
jgi:hypothetical protein